MIAYFVQIHLRQRIGQQLLHPSLLGIPGEKHLHPAVPDKHRQGIVVVLLVIRFFRRPDAKRKIPETQIPAVRGRHYRDAAPQRFRRLYKRLVAFLLLSVIRHYDPVDGKRLHKCRRASDMILVRMGEDQAVNLLHLLLLQQGKDMLCILLFSRVDHNACILAQQNRTVRVILRAGEQNLRRLYILSAPGAQQEHCKSAKQHAHSHHTQ